MIRLLLRLFGITKKEKAATAVWPLPKLADGRTCRVTSAFRTKSRPKHNGVDLLYRRKSTDPEPIGDGAGTKKWNVPKGTYVVAAKAGIVTKPYGNIKTGKRVWITHADDYRAGYFHLSKILVRVGQYVKAGQIIGTVGHNPAAHDPVHLHFEISPFGSYQPVDPVDYLRKNNAEHVFVG